MKHDMRITLLLVLLFLISQITGIALLTYDAQTIIINDSQSNESNIVVVYGETAAGPRPEVHGWGSLLYISIAIALGTLLILGLIKLKSGGFIWKLWYFMAVTIAITVTTGVFIPATIALFISLLLAFIKIKFKHPIIHNITELLMYAGIALLLVPLFSVFWTAILLVLISLYDMYAVWKSKHMVRLANFTSEQKLFPGLAISYDSNKSPRKKTYTSSKKTISKKITSRKKRLAILGGGDIIFPLLFTGTILNSLLSLGFEKMFAFGLTMIVTVITTLSVYLLFYFAKKDRFYPAMPFLSAGCFTGFGVLWLVLLFL